jgi:sugar phosphate isomerase/epimerase
VPLTIAGSTLALGTAPEGDRSAWRAGLDRVARCGFAAVDLVDSWLRLDRLDDDGLSDLRGALAGAGLAVAGVSVIRSSVIDPVDGPANVERTLRAVDAAAALGAPVISIGFHRPLRGAQLDGPFWLVPHPEDAADDAAFARAAGRLGVVCDRARAHEMQVALELHESTLLDRSARVLRLIAETGADNLGVNLDVGNLVRVPGSPAEPWTETVIRLAGHVTYWHLKNYLRVGHPAGGPVASAICPLGDGEIDYRWALREVLGAGFRGPLVVEHYGGDALWSMSEGRRYLETVLAQESLA